ncbi:ExbD/TolR family protein [Hephaestia sp. GCM10023244]|uniref:ExbD/TolR family protein n=1 Tax=unclassified Hephaestia TaxID=2631281 RepID=UPI00207797D0|nr:biopolymer transporter ExbD [Hephaestia sp. MAHUQ-44]MCM8731838.1 biopolymer transporter ExbD [Hephaestia sp. MAHUQ-44]
MAVSVGGDATETPMSEINVVPLTDVMLVLLIVFLIAIPVVIQSVPVKLPDVRFDPTTTKPENVSLSIKAGAAGDCEVYWNMTKVTSEDLLKMAVDKLKLEIDRQGGVNAPDLELPEAHIRGDVNTPYHCIGGAIYTMQMAGFARVGFISEPPPGGVTVRM